jgi:LPXTG-motif cell wall-anchored protein
MRLRALSSVVLIIAGVLCLTAAPAAIWGRNLILDTDRYVHTLKPVARDPRVQDAVIGKIDQQVTRHLDVGALLNQVLPSAAARLLRAPVQSGIETLVHTIDSRFVRSEAFQTVWVTINRTAHQQVNYLLTGQNKPSQALHVNANDQVVLNLAPVVEAVKQKLVDAGVPAAGSIPSVGATLEIADLHGFNRIRVAVRALDKAADWLPWIGLALVAGGIALARRRRRATVGSALGLVAGMLVTDIALLIGRSLSVNRIPADQLPRDTASFLFDTLVRFLRDGIRVVLLVGLLLAFGSWLAGSSRPAVSLRAHLMAVPRALAGQLDSGPVGAFVVRNIRVLQVAVLVPAVVILVLKDLPSVGTVVALAIMVALLLLALEVLRAGASGKPAFSPYRIGDRRKNRDLPEDEQPRKHRYRKAQ